MSVSLRRQRIRGSHSVLCWLARGHGEETSLEVVRKRVWRRQGNTCKGDGLVDGLEGDEGRRGRGDKGHTSTSVASASMTETCLALWRVIKRVAVVG